MKYFLLLITLNLALTGWGQKHDSTILCDTCPRFLIYKPIDVPAATQLSIVSNAKTILQLNSNGDIYYLPSAFCDCPRCRKYKGMKFLFNAGKPLPK